MPNILDYLTWRGDVPFSVSPPNEVDNYIHCKIGTLDFTGIVPENELYVPLPQAVEKLGPATAGGGGGIVSITTPIGSLWVGPLEWVLPQEYNGTVTWSGAT